MIGVFTHSSQNEKHNQNTFQMKSLSFILALAFTSISLLAQEEPKPTKETKVKVQEAGLAFSNFENFGLTYKIGNQKSLWRFYTLYFSGDNLKGETGDRIVKLNDYGIGFKIGKEFRKVIVSNLQLRYGFDILFDYSHYKFIENNDDPNASDDTRISNTYSPGIDFVIGLNYVIKDKLVLGVELLPYFSYNINFVRNNKTTGYSYGLSNSSALLSVSYRF